MSQLRKLDKACTVPFATAVSFARPGLATKVLLAFYRRHGMVIDGEPNYISSKVWFDGTDYSEIKLGNGCTVSSFVRFLTHDWAPYTVFRSFGLETEPKAGRFGSITIGDYAFVGTGTVLLPGTEIGRGSIVGAGSAVRGTVPPDTIVAGSPAVKVGTVSDYLERKFPNEWAKVLEMQQTEGPDSAIIDLGSRADANP